MEKISSFTNNHHPVVNVEPLGGLHRRKEIKIY